MRGSVQFIGGVMGLWLSSPAWSAPGLVLPADEAVADWPLLLEDAGLELATADETASVVVEDHGARWTVLVRPPGRAPRRSDVAAPRTSDDRAAVAWLAASLLDDMVSVSQAPAAFTPGEARAVPDLPAVRAPGSRSSIGAELVPGSPAPVGAELPDVRPSGPGSAALPAERAPAFELPLVVVGPSAALDSPTPSEEELPDLLLDLGPPAPPSDADRPRDVAEAAPRRPRRPFRAIVSGTAGIAGRDRNPLEGRAEIGLGVRAPSGVHLVGTLATSGPTRPAGVPSASGTVLPELGLRLGATLGARWHLGLDGLVGATQHRYREGDDVVARGWVPWLGGRVAFGRAVAGPLGAGVEGRVVRDLREVRVVVGDRASPISPMRGIAGLYLVWTPNSDPR